MEISVCIIRMITIVNLGLSVTVINPELEVDGLKGNQLPPPDTGYLTYFGRCGEINTCPGPGCVRKKRGVLKPPVRWNSTSGDDYIKGGDEVQDFTYPWMGYTEENHLGTNWRYACSAVLISSRHVLTAMHCFPELPTTLKYGDNVDATNHYRVVFGFGSPRNFTVQGKRILAPPKGVGDHDIAMMEIEEVAFNEHIRPICLPIDGFPAPSSDFVLAASGSTGVFQVPGTVTQAQSTSETLRQLDGFYATVDQILEPFGKTFPQGKTFEGYNAIKNPDPIHFWMEVPDGGNICDGDSGGGLMWLNRETSRYTIMGILSKASKGFVDACVRDDDTQLQNVIFMKVAAFIEWIIEQMKLPGTWKTCLHADCRIPRQPIVKRTWMLNVKTAHHSRSDDYQRRLSSPCAYVPELGSANKYICPVASSGRELEFFDPKNPEQNKQWRYCSTGAGCENPDWDSTHYLDEITAGSFVQKRYTGLGSIYPKIPTITELNRNSVSSYHSTCDINNEEYGHIYCPRQSDPGIECILPENICDGHPDCPDGWDESPHFCIGKCDHWAQYTYPNPGGDSDQPLNSARVTTELAKYAEICGDRCSNDQSCVHWHWYDSRGWGVHHEKTQPICKMIQSGSFEDFYTDEFMKTYSNPDVPSTDIHTHVVRGPKHCPGMADNDPQINKKYGCVPIEGIPYRGGLYLIQAFNGMYLTHDWTRDRVNMTAVPYEGVTGARTWTRRKNGIATFDTNTGWILDFFGKAGDLEQSYFTIQSGYYDERKDIAVDQDARFLTLSKNEPNVHVKPKKESPSGPKGQTQKWYMQLTRQERGYSEVKIFTKVDGKRLYVSLPKSASDAYKEYHHQLSTSHTTWVNIDNFQHNLIWDGEINDTLQQTFRLWDCNYHLDPDHEIVYRGLKRKKKKDYGSLYHILKNAFTAGLKLKKPDGTHHTSYKKTEYIFTNIFGLSHARFNQMLLLKNDDAIITMIDQVMRESESIFNYAGKMRIRQREFNTMYMLWHKWDKNGKASPNEPGDFLWEKYVKKRVDDGFLDQASVF